MLLLDTWIVGIAEELVPVLELWKLDGCIEWAVCCLVTGVGMLVGTMIPGLGDVGMGDEMEEGGGAGGAGGAGAAEVVGEGDGNVDSVVDTGVADDGDVVELLSRLVLEDVVDADGRFKYCLKSPVTVVTLLHSDLNISMNSSRYQRPIDAQP